MVRSVIVARSAVEFLPLAFYEEDWCDMRLRKGLTTWKVRVGRVALMWRWNMTAREAIRTCDLHRFRGGHGYATAGPFILEW